ncbi:MAG: tRNA dimethylallyltransferase [Candidatus Pacebacteria bacterium]|nr:tRNA dimethylallyltransferase [Candidatus Paceibacterota bacterium]
MLRKLLVICGPTATGKTGLGIDLAKRFNGEIISADSRQVYSGMDIGTGKDLGPKSNVKYQRSEMRIKNEKYQLGFYLIRNIPVWLYDLVLPDYRFTVADWLICAHLVIKDIWRQEKLPIIVGGTGFYIKSLIEGVGTLGIKPDWRLREKLKDQKTTDLARKLRRLDSTRWRLMNLSDRQNPRRLIRALEVAKSRQPAGGKSEYKNQKKIKKLRFDRILILGLKAPLPVLYQRIDQRVKARVSQGIEAEIKELLVKGYHWQNSSLGKTLGYQEWRLFFERRAAREEVIRRWQYDEHAYARRQLTWFRKIRGVCWFDPDKKTRKRKIENEIAAWITK